MRRFPCKRLICCLFAAYLAMHVGAAAAPVSQPDPRPTLRFPQFPSGQLLHLVVYGDSRFTAQPTTSTNPRVRAWLAQRIGQLQPQALLLTGDTPYTGTSSDWTAFQAETASWRTSHMLVLPATGNHEIYAPGKVGMPNYLRNFPEIAGHRYYSAILGNTEVISLDCTTQPTETSPQTRWFAAQLDHVPPQIEFLLILYHIPWMADEQSHLFVGLPSKDALVLRNVLEARLPKLRAKVVVFNGHIHNYERFERNGVMYVVSGGGGAQPYPILIRGSADLYRDTAFPVYHYLTVDIGNHQLHAIMWKIKDPGADNLEVEAKDEFTVSAPPPSANPKR